MLISATFGSSARRTATPCFLGSLGVHAQAPAPHFVAIPFAPHCGAADPRPNVSLPALLARCRRPVPLIQLHLAAGAARAHICGCQHLQRAGHLPGGHRDARHRPKVGLRESVCVEVPVRERQRGRARERGRERGGELCVVVGGWVWWWGWAVGGGRAWVDDPITTQRSHPLRSLPSRSWDSGIDTLVTYLWGISLGAVLFSIVMAALLAVPILLDPNLTVLVSFAGAKGRGEEGLGFRVRVQGLGLGRNRRGVLSCGQHVLPRTLALWWHAVGVGFKVGLTLGREGDASCCASLLCCTASLRAGIKLPQ